MPDQWIYRIVVGGLSFVAGACVIGIIVIAANNGGMGKTPEALIALGSSAIGAMAGILSPLVSKGNS